MILETFEGKFIKEYQQLVKNFWITESKSMDVLKLFNYFIKKFPQFNNNNQQDCQEVFICLLELLEKDCKKIIKKIFYSILEQETLCTTEKSIKKEETNIHILFPQKESTLTSLLHNYQDWNIIQDYEDSKGIRHHVASTRTIIKSPSPILVFSFRMYEKKTKINLEEFIEINNLKYELFSTATHMGSIRGGHYIAYTKHKGQWFRKDDESSNPIDKIPFNDYHYMALYKRLA